MTPLSITHLHLHATAKTDVILGGHHAGNDLRNAWANVIRYSTCPETHRREAPSPEHVAICPACWFLSAEDQPGSVVRPYTFEPPQPPRGRVCAGESFAFGLTLFGPAARFLPYAILSATGMGHIGVGPGRRDGLGRFEITAIDSLNPLTGERSRLLAPGDTLVRTATAPITPADATPHVDALAGRLRDNDNELRIRFLSPTRLEEGKRLYKSPDFAVFFRRLLYRIDELGRQFGGAERRDREEVMALGATAERVRLVEARTQWHELRSYSGRKGGDTPLSGLAGSATYHAADWEPLLPWLVIGQGVHAGKSAAKGNGVYEIGNLTPSYWNWL